MHDGDDVILADNIDRLRRRCECGDAADAVRHGLEQHPGSAEIMIAHGRVCLARHRRTEALHVFRRAGELAAGRDSDRIPAWEIAALSRLCRYDEAIETGRKAIDIHPGSAAVRIALGRCYLDSSDPTQAIACFTDASTAEPENWRAEAWHARGLVALYQLDEARRHAELLAARHPSEPGAHQILGEVLLAVHEPAGAIESFKAAVELDNYYVAALSQHTIALRELHKYSEAEDFVRGAIELLPKCASLYVEHAWVLSDQDQDLEAATVAGQAVQLDPNDTAALGSRISFLTYAHQYAQAQLAADEARERRPDAPRVHIGTAWLHHWLDDYDNALAHCERALTIDPRNSWALRSRIDFLRDAQKFEQALHAADKAVEQQPADPDVHTTVAWLYAVLGEHDSAVEHCEQALAIDPRNSWALRARVGVLRNAHRYDRARQAANEAVEGRPGDPDLHETIAWLHADLDDYPPALANCERALAIYPRHTAALATRVDVLHFAQRYEQAKQAARAALDHRSDHPGVRNAVASLYSDLDDHDTALEHCEQALAINPLDSWNLCCHVRFLTRAKRYEQAQDAAKIALDRRPHDSQIRLAIAWLYSNLDDHDTALEHCEQALAINPRESSTLRNRIHFLRYGRHYDRARLAATEALERQPSDPSVHITIALLYSDLGDHDTALEHCEQALAINPGESSALRVRIDVLRHAHRYQQALRAADEAQAEQPDDPAVYNTIALLHSDLGDHDTALKHCEQALAINPHDSWALYNGVIYSAFAGKFEDSQRLADVAIERRPADADLRIALAWTLTLQDRELEAAEATEQALRIDGNHPQALAKRIDFLRYAQHYEQARHAADEALERRPDDPDILNTIALLHSEFDGYDEALACCDRALEIDPGNTTARLARIDFLRYARRYDEARHAAREALEQSPDDPDAHTAVARLHLDLDDYNTSLACCDKALAIDPRHESALNTRVRALLHLQRPDDAETSAGTALEMRPRSSQATISLARVMRFKLKYEDAERIIQQALLVDQKNVSLNIARSATLRALRRFDEAHREITSLRRDKPHRHDLRLELAWICHDQGRYTEARSIFAELLGIATDFDDRSAARHGVGWVHFSTGNYLAAEQEFRAACAEDPEDIENQVALTWSLTRKGNPGSLTEAARLANELLRRQGGATAYVCMGVIEFERGNLPAAEFYLKQSIRVDPYHGSHTDLGALYVQMGRYAEAEAQLDLAVQRDWYDLNAHVELGALHLQVGGDRTLDAEREFRCALAIDPSSAAAAIGLAQALSRGGDEIEADSTLRKSLQRQNSVGRWRTQLALARLLVQRGDKQQNPDLHAEAYASAQSAIGLAPDTEADPHFVAGVAHHRMGSLTAEASGRFRYRTRAREHLQECLKRDPGHAEAQRNLQLLEREMTAARPAIWSGYAVAALTFALLAAMWTMFFLGNKVTVVLLTVTTPILVGLFTISLLLPLLIRLKLPGFEADLQAGSGSVSLGPTGQVTFGPGRVFTLTSGPTGQPPRHEP